MPQIKYRIISNDIINYNDYNHALEYVIIFDKYLYSSWFKKKKVLG